MDPKNKDDLREHLLRSLGKHKSYEQKKAEKQAARERRATRRERPRSARGRRLAEQDAADEDAGFEPMRARDLAAPPRTPILASPPTGPLPQLPGSTPRGGLLATVVQMARDGATVLAEGAESPERVPPWAETLAVGDRVRLVEAAPRQRVIAERLPRHSELSRPDPGRRGKRLVLAANADLLLIVVAVQAPRFKPGFVERLGLAARHGGLEALVVLNKLDLLPEGERDTFVAASRAALDSALEWFPCAAAEGMGLDDLKRRLRGQVAVAVGPSGVGKSTLLNALEGGGPLRRTGRVRDSDGKGRHTTTKGELCFLDGGGALIDTPGVRQFALDGLSPEELDLYFEDFAALGPCRFRNCRHGVEPGCRVVEAVREGRLAAPRYALWRRLAAEIRGGSN